MISKKKSSTLWLKEFHLSFLWCNLLSNTRHSSCRFTLVNASTISLTQLGTAFKSIVEINRLKHGLPAQGFCVKWKFSIVRTIQFTVQPVPVAKNATLWLFAGNLPWDLGNPIHSKIFFHLIFTPFRLIGCKCLIFFEGTLYIVNITINVDTDLVTMLSAAVFVAVADAGEGHTGPGLPFWTLKNAIFL